MGLRPDIFDIMNDVYPGIIKWKFCDIPFVKVVDLWKKEKLLKEGVYEYSNIVKR